MNPKYTLLALAILSSGKMSGQKNIEYQYLLWTGYNLKIKLNDTWQLRQEIDQRIYWFPWRQHQFMERTFVERKIGKGWDIATGFACFIQSLPHDPDVKQYTNNTELRPVFEVARKEALTPKIAMLNRYWAEFRFFEQEDKSFKYGNIRLRYKLEFQYAPVKQLTLKAFDEIHLNVANSTNNNVFDQNRVGCSAQYMPFTNFGFELGYFNWFQERSNGIDFYSRNILRFTIYQTLDFSKKE